jgi:probable poly-beta-1,6-N-acetyl-D-glucosamine export protein
MFLRYVHNFRAIAIVVIVAGHAAVTPTWPDDSPVQNLLLDLLDNGTVLFVFVAGFLFHHLAGRYRYRDYLTKKVTNVLVPYVLIMTPAAAYTVLLADPGPMEPGVVGLHPLLQALWIMVHGGPTFNYPLWFIPMIALFYLAAPVFIQFLRHPRLYLLLVVAVPFSMLAHRPPELDTVAIALYFLPAYVAGMWASQFRSRLEPVLDRWWGGLLAVFLLAVLAQFAFAGWHGNYYGSALFSQEHGPVDWMFAQKLLLCFTLLAVLRRLDDVLGDRLRLLGDVSFTIFFLHGWVLFATQVGYARFPGGDIPGNLVTFVLITVAAVLLPLAAAVAVQQMAGRRSRYLIGS